MLRHPLTLLTREAPPLVLHPGNTCLLLQDLHAALADPDAGWLARRARAKVLEREFDEYFDTIRLIAPNVTRMLAAFRAREMSAVYSCLGRRGDQPPSRFQQATGWEWEIDGPDGAFPEAWRPIADERVFSKPGWGALSDPAFKRHIQHEAVESVVIIGTIFDFGIRQTCYELADLGIGVLVVSDGVAALTQAASSHTSGNLAHGLTKLRSTAELLDLLEEMDERGSVHI